MEAATGKRNRCASRGQVPLQRTGGAGTPPASALREPYVDDDGPQLLRQSLADLTPGPHHEQKNCTWPLGAPRPTPCDLSY